MRSKVQQGWEGVPKVNTGPKLERVCHLHDEQERLNTAIQKMARARKNKKKYITGSPPPVGFPSVDCLDLPCATGTFHGA